MTPNPKLFGCGNNCHKHVHICCLKNSFVVSQQSHSQQHSHYEQCKDNRPTYEQISKKHLTMTLELLLDVAAFNNKILLQ